MSGKSRYNPQFCNIITSLLLMNDRMIFWKMFSQVTYHDPRLSQESGKWTFTTIFLEKAMWHSGNSWNTFYPSYIEYTQLTVSIIFSPNYFELKSLFNRILLIAVIIIRNLNCNVFKLLDTSLENRLKLKLYAVQCECYHFCH